MRLILLILLPIFLCSCGISVVPVNSPGLKVNIDEKSTSVERSGIVYTVKIQDIEIAPYRIDNPICSFYVKVVNNSNKPVTSELSSFYLVDEKSRQINAILPNTILGSVSRDSTYMIPYPFVGYYYFEDRMQEGFVNSLESSLPYYSENRPQNILLEAFPFEKINPGNYSAGLLYFNIDLYKASRVDFRIRQPEISGQKMDDIIIPFEIKR